MGGGRRQRFRPVADLQLPGRHLSAGPCNPPKIVITACCDQLTGDVEILTGWFQAGTVATGASFCTEGNVDVCSTSTGPGPILEDPRIVVCPNETAQFGGIIGACANFCP